MNNMQVELYNGKIKINFEPERHIFTTEKGEKILGVTSITTLLDKSNSLIPWAVRTMGDYILQNAKGKTIDEQIIDNAKRRWREVKQEAADIGKEIHEWIEKKINGQKPEMPKDDRVLNGVNAYLRWQDTHKIKIKESERIVYSKKHKYAGICDWWGVDGKDLVVGDHKSSKGIYNEMRYQLAAYQSALEEELGKEFKRGYIVKFGKNDGNFEVLEISREEYLKDKEAFLGLLQTKRREMELCKNYVRNDA